MRRCAVSIPSNIAEGCGRGNKELAYFLNIALGSSFELDTQLVLSKELGFINDIELLIKELNILQRQINAFRGIIKRA